MAATDHPETPSPLPDAAGEATEHPHNFEAQKEIHRRIRNDPDYDDWEYGTEPLPHEAWVEKQAAASAEGPAGA
ncbi:hypothetical protein KBY82_04470 [Cyanobium sp. AMD-g]|uniref:hypothetical protein n=1 Tax=Cyanobium sp. AMD-g TaxID=2823699 RepID=UPI0020CC880D|nr:hypothetical protein [Cyanobium sp. AMD-g]MCP9930035.1 hypothetical protein [Cyanobium sp. AMD-g]